MLKRMRLLSALSAFYASPERLTGLLRRLSNQLIAVCRRAVPGALSGDAAGVLTTLQVHAVLHAKC